MRRLTINPEEDRLIDLALLGSLSEKRAMRNFLRYYVLPRALGLVLGIVIILVCL